MRGEDIGSILGATRISKYFTTQLVRAPYWLTENLIFLGEIERTNEFENADPIGQCEQSGIMVDDHVIDDSALVYKSPEGLVIITGCSHAGV